MPSRPKALALVRPAPVPDSGHFIRWNSEGPQKLVMSLRSAAFEFHMPASHGIFVHARGAQHFDPKFFVHAGWTFARSHLPQHAGQEPLPVFQANNIIGCFAHALFGPPGSGFT